MVKALRKGMSDNARRGALVLQGEIARLLRSGGQTGREYLVPGGVTKRYTASAPGEVPALRTGTLARSYENERVGEFAFHVGSRLEYARHLELGTSRMAPRPHFKRAAREGAKKIEAALRRPIEND